jgi:membrane-associated phospholipid phosphatase
MTAALSPRFLYSRRLRLSRAIRGTAWALVAAGAAAPLLRRRLSLPKGPVLASAAAAPVALCVAAPKGRGRDIAVCALQMWAYLAAYEMPNDDPQALRDRVHVKYPIHVDRVIGLGRIPTQRLQEAFSTKGEINRFERALVWCHWSWFAVPHLAVAYTALRKPQQLGTAAARMYAVFDLGATVYWLLPTAPPWWAAAHGYIEHLDGAVRVGESGHRYDMTSAPLPVRRMMLEYGEQFWGSRWNDLYDVLGGNPLAAMPSLHFATSLMAARLLTEAGPVAGAIGWTYAGTLGLALVYLGEHYAVDVLAGAALAETVHRSARPVTPAVHVLTRALRALRAAAEPG